MKFITLLIISICLSVSSYANDIATTTKDHSDAKAVIGIANTTIQSKISTLKKRNEDKLNIFYEGMSRKGQLNGTPMLGRLSELCIKEIEECSQLIQNALLRVVYNSGISYSDELAAELKNVAKKHLTGEIGNIDGYIKQKNKFGPTLEAQLAIKATELMNKRSNELKEINSEINLLTISLKNQAQNSSWLHKHKDPIIIGLIVTVVGGLIVGLILRFLPKSSNNIEKKIDELNMKAAYNKEDKRVHITIIDNSTNTTYSGSTPLPHDAASKFIDEKIEKIKEHAKQDIKKACEDKPDEMKEFIERWNLSRLSVAGNTITTNNLLPWLTGETKDEPLEPMPSGDFIKQLPNAIDEVKDFDSIEDFDSVGVKMNQSNKNQVFLSYVNEDLETVKIVFDGLKKRGLNVWFDKEHIKPGPWKPQIEKAISKSKFFVICISEAALRKTGDEPGFQDDELNRAYNIAEKQSDQDFVIVPVRLEECGRGDTRLSSFQQYDLLNDFEGGLDKLSVDIGGSSLSDSTAKDERTEDEKTISHLMNRANAASYAGKYEEAITILGSVLTLDPTNSKAWNDRGAFLGKLGSYAEAMESFEKAIKIAPKDYLAWNNKATALYSLNNNEEAIKAYDQTIKFKPDFYQAYNNKGIALGKLDRHKEAIDVYDQAINITPNHHFAWYNKGVALAFLDRHDEAIEAYDQATEYKSDYYEAWYNKGNSLVILGRLKEAIEAFDQAVKYKHDYYYAWYNKGVALNLLGQHKEAEEAFDQANKYKPKKI